MASISLEMTNRLTDCDKGYIDIRCDVVGESFKEMSMSLQRLDRGVKSVVVQVKGDVVITISEPANQTGVLVNFSISDNISYLSIRIMSSMVKPLQDKGPYQCFLTGLDTSYAAITEKSSLKTLNYTGNIGILIFI